MKRERFSKVGCPNASIRLSSLWSSTLRTSATLRSSRPRSSTMPVFGSGVPRTLISARKEWPWISSLAAPSVVPASACAASKRNDLVNSHISLTIQSLSDTECLVCLQAEPPLWMPQAIVDGTRGVLRHVRSVHRLQRETLEVEAAKFFRLRAGLRIDQLQLMPALEQELCASLRADADPVHAVGRNNRAVGLDGHREAARMQRIDQRLIDLQERLTSGQHHIAVGI